jgi:N4-gp56 family major capsid protein
MDSIRWTALTGLTAAAALPTALSAEAYTPNFYSVGGTSTGVDDIGSGDTLTTAALQQIKLKLRIQRAKPIMVDGFPHYIMVTHPYSTYDLKRETEYTSWVRDAQVRGDANPFFRGAIAVIDGMIIYEHESCPIVTNAGSQAVSKGIAFGAEFAVEALDENVDWEEDTFDYGKDWGVGYSFAFYPRRGLELSSCQVYAESGNPVV